MHSKDWSRRDFTKLSMAALGGAIGGATLSGCAEGEGGMKTAADGSAPMKEPHVCRGLNACKSKGASGDNACAGQGKCATAKSHSCAGQNACKGQGGCGAHPGEHACKGQGKCAVPLSDKAWSKARKDFEAAMNKAGKQFGSAPAKG